MELLVYIDDIVLARNETNACKQFKIYLDACFSIKDLGQLKYFMGIEVAHGAKDMFLSQRKYALEIIDESDLLGTKSVDFPIEKNHKLAFATGRALNDPTRYRRFIGRFIYLTITRPDLCSVCIESVHACTQRRTHGC